MAVGPSQRPAPKATRSPTKALKSEGIHNLIGAAENGDLASIRLLLEQGVRVTSANRVSSFLYVLRTPCCSPPRALARPNLAPPLYPALSVCSCSPDSTRLAEAHRAPHDTQPTSRTRLVFTVRRPLACACSPVECTAPLYYILCAHLTPTPPQSRLPLTTRRTPPHLLWTHRVERRRSWGRLRTAASSASTISSRPISRRRPT